MIDTDLNQRALSRMFIDRAAFGIVEVLNGISDVQDVVVHDPNLPVAFFPCAPTRHSVPPRLPANTLAQCLRGLDGEYDLILLDGASVSGESSFETVSRLADSVVLVTDLETAGTDEYKAAAHRMLSLEEKFEGVVVLR